MKTLTGRLKLNHAVLRVSLLVAMTAAVVPNEAFAEKPGPLSCLINYARLGLDKSGTALRYIFSLGKRACGEVSDTEIIPDVATFKRTCAQDPTNTLEVQKILNFSPKDIEDIRGQPERSVNRSPPEDVELGPKRIEGTTPEPLTEGDQWPAVAAVVSGEDLLLTGSADQPIRLADGSPVISLLSPSEPTLDPAPQIEEPIHFSDVLLAELAEFKGNSTLQQTKILHKAAWLKKQYSALIDQISNAQFNLLQTAQELELDSLKLSFNRLFLTKSELIPEIGVRGMISSLKNWNKMQTAPITPWLQHFREFKVYLLDITPVGNQRDRLVFVVNETERRLVELKALYDELQSSKYSIIKMRLREVKELPSTLQSLNADGRLRSIFTAFNQLTEQDLAELAAKNSTLGLFVRSYQGGWERFSLSN